MTTIAVPPPQSRPKTPPQPSANPRLVKYSAWIPTTRFYVYLGLGLVIPVIISLLPGPDAPPRTGQDLVTDILWFLVGDWRNLLGLGLLVVYNLVLLGLGIWDFRRSLAWAVDIQRTCEPRLSIGRNNTITLTVISRHSRFPTKETTAILVDHLPLGLEPPNQYFEPGLGYAQPHHDDHQFEFLLKAGQQTRLTYSVFPGRRGEFTWPGLVVRIRSPWGLAWWHRLIPVTTKVDVYPDLIGLRALSVRLSLEASGSLRRRRHALGGTEFAELRDYYLGDDLRMMDWKATARRGRPLVRVMEPERDQPLIILLDRGRLMTAQVAGLKRFDWALNAALALAMTGLRRGDRVGVAVFDQGLYRWIAPQAGDSHLGQILAQIYHVEPVMKESDYIGTVSTLLGQYTRRALVVMLTEIIDETASGELLAAMTRLTPRFLPFCVTFRDPLVDRLSHQSLGEKLTSFQALDTLYDQAVALDLLQQRQRAFAKVKQQGVLVLDAPAPQLSEALVDQYLLLKARGRL
ncbi:DUF58 domain-containing protein [Synechococcus sp. PCC 6312]|uniref:DUF58 domain-containing protein n=1 Tax=Synechococcus sp. (strain ATCC 27167 / PCC 6312) TaxID=195253 RepID=UPI00029F0EA5|nr:DUF58 domain-containing protein [Synechococcus sp. PCC 6312]AFY59571.1 hypothetical protein Syn6312_0338 [Synechococcus sp. PCC 6312]